MDVWFLERVVPWFSVVLVSSPFCTLFLIWMLVLDLLPSKLILILRLESFQTNSNDDFTLKTKAYFARSKSKDLNDFLIHSNALNIWLPRNLSTQSRGDRFHEYINTWQLTNTYPNKYYFLYRLNLYWLRKFVCKFCP